MDNTLYRVGNAKCSYMDSHSRRVISHSKSPRCISDHQAAFQKVIWKPRFLPASNVSTEKPGKGQNTVGQTQEGLGGPGLEVAPSISPLNPLAETWPHARTYRKGDGETSCPVCPGRRGYGNADWLAISVALLND